jgi:hypothetical protein
MSAKQKTTVLRLSCVPLIATKICCSSALSTKERMYERRRLRVGRQQITCDRPGRALRRSHTWRCERAAPTPHPKGRAGCDVRVASRRASAVRRASVLTGQYTNLIVRCEATKEMWINFDRVSAHVLCCCLFLTVRFIIR